MRKAAFSIVLSLALAVPACGAAESVEKIEEKAMSLVEKDRPDETVKAFSRLIAVIDCKRAQKTMETRSDEAYLKALDDLFRLAQGYNCRGTAYGEMGKFDKAKSDLDRALSIDPVYSQAFCNRGILCGLMGNNEAAIKDLNESIRLNVRFVDAYDARARIYAKLGHSPQADRDRRLSNDWLTKNNTEGGYHQIWFDYGQFAIRQLTKSLTARPRQESFLVWRASNYFELHESKKALKDVEAAIAIEPRDPEARRVRADIDRQMGDYKRASQDLALAMKIGPKTVEMYKTLCAIDSASGDLVKVVKDHTEGLKLAPKEPWFMVRRGNCYLRMARFEEAVKDYTQALKVVAPVDLPYVYGYRGMAYVELKQYGKAVADAVEAIRLNPRCASGYLVRGICYKRMGKLKSAQIDLDQAESLQPMETKALEASGELAAARGDFEQSLADIEFANRLDGQAPRQRRQLLSVSADEYQKSIADYTRILKLDDSNDEALFNRAILYFCVDNLQLSIADFHSFLNLVQWQGDSSSRAAILSCIAYRSLKRERDAKQLLDSARVHFAKRLHPVELAYYFGELSEQAALKQAVDRSGGTVLRCYIALDLASRGEKTRALEHLQWIAHNGDRSVDEYMIAMSTFRRLQKPDGKK